VSQRNNNHKVLQRLNAEILTHQQNVRQFLRQNRQLIPNVSPKGKSKVFRLLQDYVEEARVEISGVAYLHSGSADGFAIEVLQAVKELPLLVSFLQPQSLAIPVSVKARVLKMAALYDFQYGMQILEEQLFVPLKDEMPLACLDERTQLDEVFSRIKEELSNNVAEEAAASATGGTTPTPMATTCATPAGFCDASPTFATSTTPANDGSTKLDGSQSAATSSA